MRLQLGTKLGEKLCDVLIGMFPARRTELENLKSGITMGISLDIESTKPKHTDEQRGYYWRSLKSFGREMGYTAWETERILHLSMCCHAYGVKDYVALVMPDGEVSRMALPLATSSHDETGKRRDRESYSLLIETMLRIAGENGVYIQPPIVQTHLTNKG